MSCIFLKAAGKQMICSRKFCRKHFSQDKVFISKHIGYILACMYCYQRTWCFDVPHFSFSFLTCKYRIPPLDGSLTPQTSLHFVPLLRPKFLIPNKHKINYTNSEKKFPTVRKKCKNQLSTHMTGKKDTTIAKNNILVTCIKSTT